MLTRMLVFALMSALSFLAYISYLPADQEYLHSGDAGVLLASNRYAVTIQVSSFKKQHDAEKEIARLKSHGVDAWFKDEIVQDKGRWYRVYVGHFKNESDARAYADRLKAQGMITWAWIKPEVSLPPKPEKSKQVLPAPKVSSRTASELKPEPVKSPAASPLSADKERKPFEPRPARIAKPSAAVAAPTSIVLGKPSVKEDETDQNEPSKQGTSKKEAAEASLPGTFNFSSQTTLRAFQRDTSEGEDTLVIPIYEYMEMDFGDAEKGGWSVHAYGWGRSDLADSAYFEETSDAGLLYGYLEYNKPYSDLHLVMGRQQIFAGVTNETVDGLQLAAGYTDVLTATAFGGMTSASDETSADTTYGGRIAFHPKPAYELALSYQNTDLEGDPDQRAGVDFSLNWSDWLTFQGLSSYNLDSEDWREHNYSAALRYLDLILEPAYQFFSYKDYFGTGTEENNLFRFLQDAEEQVSIAGADLQYQGSFPLRLTGRYNQYTYSIRQEAAAYYAVLISVDLPGGSQLGGEAGRMDGETDDNIYTLYRVYFYWFNPFNLGSSAFISGDAIFQAYDAPVFGRDDATNYTLSGGLRFFEDALEVKLTGVYSQDPYFDDNLEGILTLQINY